LRKGQDKAKILLFKRIEADVPPDLLRHPSAPDLCRQAEPLVWGKEALGYEDTKTATIPLPVVNPPGEKAMTGSRNRGGLSGPLGGVSGRGRLWGRGTQAGDRNRREEEEMPKKRVIIGG
jgi:hypothetical protein